MQNLRGTSNSILLTFLTSFLILINQPVTVIALHRQDIHSIDFHNFSYEHSEGWGGRAVVLHNGSYSYKD
jgi:hypothetical protein